MATDYAANESIEVPDEYMIVHAPTAWSGTTNAEGRLARQLTVGYISGPLTVTDRRGRKCVLSEAVLLKKGGIVTMQIAGIQSAACTDILVEW